ncbi:hypothetical protein K2173_006040 [Erythroxylum novogranatense]|uniref:Uncharacterized protein n=1 Tax=Erythroxylum novogranatense TaxID=1862640 RepID=A0AAV8TDJ6_9ROSI|nr:hypothetical protein K2173_006040 [Erythroxylum novogranatense]
MTDLNGIKKDDPFLLHYQPSDLRIALEFLNNWLPFRSRDLCRQCAETLSRRILSLDPYKSITHSATNGIGSHENCCDDNCDKNSLGSWKDGDDTNSLGGWEDGTHGWSESAPQASANGILVESHYSETTGPRMSWAKQREISKRVVDTSPLTGGLRVSNVDEKPKLSRKQREHIQFMSRFKRKLVNILEGLELRTGVFSAVEQKRIVDHAYELYEMERKGELKERTYIAPQKWMRGKGHVTLQFGCCYNYATYKNGNPPDFLRNGHVDPITKLFKVIIRRLVKWHVLHPTCVPDSCIVNIYEVGDCIPPLIDNHDFLRPFCTVSFLSESNIVFGSNLKVLGAGEFTGSIAIPLPVGSVLVLNGNAADVSKNCAPSVPTKRISITFRKMDETEQPVGFVPEPDLQGIQSNSHKFEDHVKRKPTRKETRMEIRDFAEDSLSEHYYLSCSR